MRVELVKRPGRSKLFSILSPFIAFGLTLIAGAILFAVLGKNPGLALYTYFIDPLTEMWSMVVLAAIWIGTGGPWGKGSMRRRRGVYWLRPRWAGAHIGGISRLFGLRYEIDFVHNYATTVPDATEGLLAFKEKRRPSYQH